MTGPIESHCARCLRPNPDANEGMPNEWEVLVDADVEALGVSFICDDCITPEEQQAMDEADMALLDELEASGLNQDDQASNGGLVPRPRRRPQATLNSTAHHEAGHAVAIVMRGGGELVSATIEPDGDSLGRTFTRIKPFGDDALFVTFAGPWAEARARWPLPTLDREDDDGATFADYLAGAWLLAGDGDADDYENLCDKRWHMNTLIADSLGITTGDLRSRQERGWGNELEQAWEVIEQVAAMLRAGDTVTDAVVRGLVAHMWEEAG